MRKIGLSLLLIVAVFLSADAVYADDNLTDRYILHFSEGIDYQLLEPFNYDVDHELTLINRLAVTVTKQEAEKIKQVQGITIEKDEPVKINQQFIGYQHQLTINHATNTLGLTGDGVKVAVLDTGIKTTHPDLVVAGGVNTIDKQQSYNDDNGHGTHVAGIIAATNNNIGVVGLSPGVELYAIKALDANGEGTQTDIIAGIQWAIEQEIDIINLSITTSVSTDALKSMLDYSYDKGIISVAASGNDYSADAYYAYSVTYPAKYPSVIAVGSIDEYYQPSYFSQPGRALEFVAPGENILSTYIDADFPYTEMSGTSMATPVVTAILSLYKEAYPTLSTQSIREYAQKSAKDLGPTGRDDFFGYGLIQQPVNFFIDVTDNVWYYEAVQQAAKKDIIKGYEGALFKPTQSVTRAEFVTFLSRLLVTDAIEESPIVFTDVNETLFAYDAIKQLTNMDVISGYPDQTFRPFAPITRGEVATLLYRALNLPDAKENDYADLLEQAFYYDAVVALSGEGILSGYPDGSFKPDESMTRAEVANVIHLLTLKDDLMSIR